MAFEFLKRRLVARDIQALEELFNQFHETVYKSAYFITHDRMLAEDVVQNTFLKAYDKIDQLKDSSRVESWLIQIAVNQARDEIRRRHRQAWSQEEAHLPGPPEELPEFQVVAREEHAVISAAIDGLAAEYQDVILLKYQFEMTTKRIAETLNIPEGTVKTRLRKARAILESVLRESGFAEQKVEGG
ncbi:RNA polymerase sigma factor [Candidatus Desulforudis audaxviator]|uniref:RNA polymerase sigma factor n=1 Tax=Desulforudis audaxviator (strain MP104C) TaxID=477974 RepID=B1I489_DESAP|nr:RNA polymerase sigma factor [Candidatus Desulforudis audaxviator]ACA59783.1 RNA polymerase, sigma-24 subunit, ECF subfamily [Candidatus Desulforudis audaxviator MP104C]AZK59785.1 RNA polymerase sigma factor SigW [Candidatus Desulforudis audaxviator]